MEMLDIEVFEGGFKETELGPLPEEWEVVRLGEVAEIIMGQSPPGESLQYSRCRHAISSGKSGVRKGIIPVLLNTAQTH
jgi:restriction endonuclease S subunit